MSATETKGAKMENNNWNAGEREELIASVCEDARGELEFDPDEVIGGLR